MQWSFWFYGVAFDGANRILACNFSSPTAGWILRRDISSNTVMIYADGSITTGVPYTVGAWNHCFAHLFDGKLFVYVNGVQSSIIAPTVSSISTAVQMFGNAHAGAGSGLTSNDVIADAVFWYNAPEFTADQVKQIYNAGNYRPFNVGSVRYRYKNTGLTGQKISAKAQLSRTTTAVSPAILKAGLLLG
jgi:hypothetical protein